MNPQPFGYYTLINRINIGGMAEVFKACYYQENGIPFSFTHDGHWNQYAHSLVAQIVGEHIHKEYLPELRKSE